MVTPRVVVRHDQNGRVPLRLTLCLCDLQAVMPSTAAQVGVVPRDDWGFPLEFFWGLFLSNVNSRFALSLDAICAKVKDAIIGPSVSLSAILLSAFATVG